MLQHYRRRYERLALEQESQLVVIRRPIPASPSPKGEIHERQDYPSNLDIYHHRPIDRVVYPRHQNHEDGGAAHKWEYIALVRSGPALAEFTEAMMRRR